MLICVYKKIPCGLMNLLEVFFGNKLKQRENKDFWVYFNFDKISTLLNLNKILIHWLIVEKVFKIKKFKWFAILSINTYTLFLVILNNIHILHHHK